MPLLFQVSDNRAPGVILKPKFKANAGQDDVELKLPAIGELLGISRADARLLLAAGVLPVSDDEFGNVISTPAELKEWADEELEEVSIAPVAAQAVAKRENPLTATHQVDDDDADDDRDNGRQTDVTDYLLVPIKSIMTFVRQLAGEATSEQAPAIDQDDAPAPAKANRTNPEKRIARKR